MTQEFPRVLRVLTTSDPSDTTARFVANLFAGWPDGHLLDVTLQPPAEAGSPIHNPVGTAIDAALATRRGLSSSQSSTTPAQRANAAIATNGTTFAARVKDGLGLVRDAAPIRLKGDTIRRIRGFQPQVVYSPLGSIHIMRAVQHAMAVSGAPFVPHIMDDWLETLHSGVFWGAGSTLSRRQVRHLFDNAPVALAIGPEMAERLHSSYRVEAVGVGNSADFRRQRTRVTPPRDEPLALLYAGSLNLNRNQQLSKVASILESSPQLRRWSIDLYCPPSYAADAEALQRDHRSIKYQGSLSSAEIPAALSKANVLLFVESFDPAVLEYTRYSASSKIADYLASATPVLAVGPHEQASIRELERLGACIAVAGEDQDEAIAATVRRGLADAQDGWRVSPQRWHAWAEIYGKEQVFERLRSSLAAAVYKSRNSTP